jgi:small subunit ribosomal protein S18
MAYDGRGKGAFVKHRICRFCADPSLAIDCAKHQRILAIAIKRARNIALLPFTTAKVKMKEY